MIDTDKVYDILVNVCGADPDPYEKKSFEHAWPKCVEYRFIGKLGFGGKVWSSSGKVYVTCYRENETPEKLAMIKEANRQLKELVP